MTVASSKLSHPRELSRRADAMPRSAIREIMALAASRADVIHLEVGEPDFGTPEHIVAAAFTAVRAGATKYTGNAGRLELREQIAARMRARTRAAISAEHVIVTVGAIGALYTALMSILDAGDEVLIPDPGWPNYEAIAVLAGARPVRYPLSAKAAFVPDPDDIARRIGPRTKAVLLNSPGNPTGAVFAAETVAAHRRLGRTHRRPHRQRRDLRGHRVRWPPSRFVSRSRAHRSRLHCRRRVEILCDDGLAPRLADRSAGRRAARGQAAGADRVLCADAVAGRRRSGARGHADGRRGRPPPVRAAPRSVPRRAGTDRRDRRAAERRVLWPRRYSRRRRECAWPSPSGC